MIDGEEKKTANGIVEEVLPDSLFRVRMPLIVPAEPTEEGAPPVEAVAVQETDGGELILAYLAGKMRLHRIRVLVGDQVEMVLDPYGGRARIVRRLT